ncbi:DUF6361 family protein [Arthrobacter sp. H14]|uniref:DUF6361 family protein n=1 Tax=Arthrobacter sp. H14 TaxID=1312959 RepID=UPI000478AC35|nr:DUF6361 family protein [Arthrobacter sp. H14]
MPSLISWLDASTDENTRMRELVKLFGSPETTDDLGTGQVRDVISNSLFPGTSVLHAGARYMLLVPWAYLSSYRRGMDPDRSRANAEEAERRLIERFRELGMESFIGRDAGRNVQQLPSGAYWSALRTYGIVSSELNRATVTQAMSVSGMDSEADETSFVWHPTLPEWPEGFPRSEERGLELSVEEARWLQERILATCEGTLLAHIMTAGGQPTSGSPYPWADSGCKAVGGEAAQWLRDAELFSFIHHGANILYNHLVAEAVARDVPDAGLDAVEHTATLLDNWEQQRPGKQELLAAWDVEDFLRRAKEKNRNISTLTMEFVRVMTDAARDTRELVDNEDLRAAVMKREMLMKKANSRFRHQRRLRNWQPPNDVAAIGFRWTAVRRTALDIHEGLSRA